MEHRKVIFLFEYLLGNTKNKCYISALIADEHTNLVATINLKKVWHVV